MTVKLSIKKRIHFLGIGGSGMSPLAGAVLEKGWSVSGTDLKSTPVIDQLISHGAQVFFGHCISNLDGVEVVVVSTAIAEDNVEYVYAKKQGLLVLRRAEMLDYLMNDSRHKFAVAGTHGKTTTSGFVATMLDVAGAKPNFIIGSVVSYFDSSFSLKKSDYFVAEADESDGSFLSLHPTFGILTNIEAEHMNYFGTLANLKKHFSQFIQGIVDRKGFIAINGDDCLCVELLKSHKSIHIKTFGLKKSCHYHASSINYTTLGMTFDVYRGKTLLGALSVRQFGEHNVYNALGALVVGLGAGFSFDVLKKGLEAFQGTRRRMQSMGEAKGVHIYDDYAHHPTEIKTTLSGIKKCLDKRLICIFQPHRYTRTRDLLGDFSESFLHSDIVLVTDVYPAGESPLSGINSDILARLIQSKNSGEVWYVSDADDVVAFLKPKLKSGDIVITMGAGDICKQGPLLVAALKGI